MVSISWRLTSLLIVSGFSVVLTTVLLNSDVLSDFQQRVARDSLTRHRVECAAHQTSYQLDNDPDVS